MLPLDRWALEKTRQLVREVTSAYDVYEFHRAYRAILTFCTVTLSATYHDMLKDRLYTYGANWLERRSAQTALHKILMALISLLAPITTFTADEAYAHLQCNAEFAPRSVHLIPWPTEEEFSGHGAVAEEVEGILKIRSAVNLQLEGARQRKVIGKSLDGRVTLEIGEKNDVWALLKKYEEFLPEFFIVSQVSLIRTTGENVVVRAEKAKGERCARSWRWCEDLCEVPGWGRVSPRCARVLGELFPNSGN
jgi:isoleucyl-tRNA synthetase